MNEINPLLHKPYKTIKKWGYITILLGILAIALPLAIGFAVTFLFSIVLIIAGLVQIMAVIPGEGRAVRSIWAVLTLIAGFSVLFMPSLVLASLTLFLGVYFLLDALANFGGAWKLSPNHGWGYVAMGGVSSLIMAIIILWQWPVSSEFVIGILVGVKLISLGTVFLTLGKTAENSIINNRNNEKTVN